MDNNAQQQKATIERLESEIKENQKGIVKISIVSAIVVIITVIGWIADSRLLLILGILATIVFIIILFGCIQGIGKFKQDLEKAKTNYEAYEKEQERLKVIREAERKANIRVEAAKHPQCPMCGSLQTRRISTANRAVSVYAVGLASDKIGKQYECLKCKHKW